MKKSIFCFFTLLFILLSNPILAIQDHEHDLQLQTSIEFCPICRLVELSVVSVNDLNPYYIIYNKKCRKCNYTVEDKVYKGATCTTDGYELYKCACGYEEIRKVLATGHDYDLDNLVISETGHYYRCKKCSNATNFEEHKADHELQCGEPANCIICSKVFTQSHLTEHIDEIPATCTKTGTKEYWKCTRCNKLFNDYYATKEISSAEIIDKIPHNYENTITPAILGKDGNITIRCTIGGETKTTVIPKINNVTLSKMSFTYNNKEQKPSVTIKDRTGKVLKDGTDYTISYSNKNSKKVGEYKVTVTFKGDYSGSKTLTYQITPKGTKLSKVTKGKKQFKATWKKQTTETTGYQVQYSTSKNFSSGNKTITIKKNKTTSSTAKKLKAKKKYYVRIRTYKTVNGKKIYSGWSASKSVKTK